MQVSFSAALAKAARLEQATPFEQVQAVLREEVDHLGSRLRRSIERVREPERGSEVFRELVERLERSGKHGVHATELDFLRRRAESRGLSELAQVIGDALASLDELHARADWLVRGTPAEQLAELDPRRDSDRIYHHLLRNFRAEARVVETLAINRVATWQSLALFLRTTREAERNPIGRFFDTYALFANYFEWGEHSERGARAVERINQIHGRYFLPNDGMKYVLLNTAFTWLDGIDRIGHRALSPLEREGFFQAHVRLGKAMNIRELSSDSAEMYAWFQDVNARNAFHTPLKTETFELFVKNSFGAAATELEVMLAAARVAMDDHYRAALGYGEPSAREKRTVRAALAALAERAEARPGAIYLRSLSRTPNRVESGHPSQLGVSERSRWLPRVSAGENAGYPAAQAPLRSVAEAPEMRLPSYSWDEIRRHATPDSVWIVIDGDVYDVTNFLREHPGGAERLLEWAGRDASAAFTAAPHGSLTQVLRLNYRVGRVGGAL
ncbi:MAG TPA: cytochrome b5-like heme/steroid binding domain-containing protein [Polyangiaceae bacterium]|nr:cytochrome b5-like heme/steroid binding domain-containing protein [Polyangiaceae bacterium]